jgi:hypothetical protein
VRRAHVTSAVILGVIFVVIVDRIGVAHASSRACPCPAPRPIASAATISRAATRGGEGRRQRAIARIIARVIARVITRVVIVVVIAVVIVDRVGVAHARSLACVRQWRGFWRGQFDRLIDRIAALRACRLPRTSPRRLPHARASLCAPVHGD